MHIMLWHCHFIFILIILFRFYKPLAKQQQCRTPNHSIYNHHHPHIGNHAIPHRITYKRAKHLFKIHHSDRKQIIDMIPQSARLTHRKERGGDQNRTANHQRCKRGAQSTPSAHSQMLSTSPLTEIRHSCQQFRRF